MLKNIDNGTQSDEEKELNDLINDGGDEGYNTVNHVMSKIKRKNSDCEDEEEVQFNGEYTQWTSISEGSFIPAGKSKQILPPGMYAIKERDGIGIYFQKINIKNQDLLVFPDSRSKTVVNEIKSFWGKEKKFREYGISYKRGILLWGPAGSGKSCTLQLVAEDVIDRGGICLNFDSPYLFKNGMRILRKIQKDVPVVVLMEDIESILRCYNESEILNILDGIEEMDKVLFLATTNYPEELGSRIINRPSRFDKRFKIGFPSPEARKMYLEKLINKKDLKKISIDQWVKDSDGFSLAHLKELFTAVIVLGDKYETAIETLKNMKEKLSSANDGNGTLGFHMAGTPFSSDTEW